MTFSADVIRQIARDRQQDLHAQAAAHRLAETPRARSRFAERLRRTAVRGETTSRSAISAFVNPSATSVSTSS